MPPPDWSRDKVNWLVVIPTKPRARVDMQYALTIAYPQTGMMTLVECVNDVIPISFMDESELSKDVNDDMCFSFTQVNHDIDEAEEDTILENILLTTIY